MTDARIEVTLHQPQLDRVVGDFAARATQRAAHRSADRMKGIINREAKDTGKLRDSIEVFEQQEQSGKVSVLVGSLLHYARVVDQGRGPIFAKPGKFLVFKPGGSNKFVFAKKVRGVEPVNFMSRALKDLSAKDFVE